MEIFVLEILQTLSRVCAVSLADISKGSSLAPVELSAVLNKLAGDGYVDNGHGISGLFRLTEKGLAYRIELEQAAKQMADVCAEKKEESRAQEAKSTADRKKQFRHDFVVAAFSVALTLLAEHCNDIFDFVATLFNLLA